jgi:hypothetical protein
MKLKVLIYFFVYNDTIFETSNFVKLLDYEYIDIGSKSHFFVTIYCFKIKNSITFCLLVICKTR